ncbi:Lipoamide acyltransferase component of branched-chain alpha-keto acid dehydrogenase complex [Hordeum vulgare]|nr:Lipoamide acyltransferase component of branched-chain alpha-keto acid dehydrogenase complex [Hordeum vulgare]
MAAAAPDGSAKLRVFLFPTSGADQPASGSGSHLAAVDKTGQRYIDAINCVSANAVVAIRRRESVATAACPCTTPRPPSPPASRKSLGFSVVAASTPTMGIPAHNPGAPDRRDGKKEPLGSLIGFPSCSRIRGRLRRGQPGRCSSAVQGDQVDEFQQLCEVQSDKATIEITSRFKGTVHQIQFAPRDIVKVGETLLKMIVSGSQVVPHDSMASSPDVPLGVDATSPLREASAPRGSLSTPAIRHLVKQYGLNIDDIQGTGRDGTVLKEDVLNYAASKGVLQEPQSSLEEDVALLCSFTQCTLTLVLHRTLGKLVLKNAKQLGPRGHPDIHVAGNGR